MPGWQRAVSRRRGVGLCIRRHQIPLPLASVQFSGTRTAAGPGSLGKLAHVLPTDSGLTSRQTTFPQVSELYFKCLKTASSYTPTGYSRRASNRCFRWSEAPRWCCGGCRGSKLRRRCRLIYRAPPTPLASTHARRKMVSPHVPRHLTSSWKPTGSTRTSHLPDSNASWPPSRPTFTASESRWIPHHCLMDGSKTSIRDANAASASLAARWYRPDVRRSV